ncbi:hypothetical protein [Bacillus manliponensis]|nr:hypothetical protein [Bacillus manliponensis]
MEQTNIALPEDFRALTPLIYAHVNPYGTFKLNMKERLTIQSSSYRVVN